MVSGRYLKMKVSNKSINNTEEDCNDNDFIGGCFSCLCDPADPEEKEQRQ